MQGAVRIFIGYFPEYAQTDLVRNIEAANPMIVEGFRSFLDFPDQLDAIDSDAIDRIGQALVVLLQGQVDSAEPVPGNH